MRANTGVDLTISKNDEGPPFRAVFHCDGKAICIRFFAPEAPTKPVSVIFDTTNEAREAGEAMQRDGTFERAPFYIAPDMVVELGNRLIVYSEECE